jgi:hypothetical protein
LVGTQTKRPAGRLFVLRVAERVSAPLVSDRVQRIPRKAILDVAFHEKIIQHEPTESVRIRP